MDLPGGPVVKALHLTVQRGMGLIPGWGTKILHVTWYSQNFFKN